jgi:hypothetical protein
VNKREQNTLNGVLVYGDMPVATVKDGEVFLHATGEKVAFIGDGGLRGRNGELLGSVEALPKGQTLSAREKRLLKLPVEDPLMRREWD